jgi:hypothetical protein
MWGEVEKSPEFIHVFFHPVRFPRHSTVVQRPLKRTTIQRSDEKSSSNCQRIQKSSVFEQFRKSCHQQTISLVLSVITRWGTQYRLITSLLKNKDALKRCVGDYEDFPPKQRIKQPVIDTIMDWDFWNELELMRELLQPIDERLKMSESGKSHLGHVLNRWMDLLKHLNEKKKEIMELETFIADGTFRNRYARQVLPIHIVAYYLCHRQYCAIEILQTGRNQQCLSTWSRYRRRLKRIYLRCWGM